MKFYVSAPLFRDAVTTVCRFASSNSPAAEFHSIRVKLSDDGRIHLYAQSPRGEWCNLSIPSTPSAKTDNAPFMFFIDGRLFKSVVDTVRGDLMAVSLEANRITVGFSGGSTKIPTCDSGKDPVDNKVLKTLLIPIEKLKTSISIARASEKSDVGNCCFGSTQDETLMCVGTDSSNNKSISRFSFSEISKDYKLDKVLPFSGKSMGLCLAACYGENVSMSFGERHIRLESEDENHKCECGMVLGIYGAGFPVYQLIAMTSVATVEVNREEFFSACKQLSVLKLAESVATKIDFHPEIVKLSIKTTAGESFADVKNIGAAQPLDSMYINIESMCDLARAFSSDTIHIGVCFKPGSSTPDHFVIKDKPASAVSGGITEPK